MGQAISASLACSPGAALSARGARIWRANPRGNKAAPDHRTRTRRSIQSALSAGM